jgi:hypothetical protein
MSAAAINQAIRNYETTHNITFTPEQRATLQSVVGNSELPITSLQGSDNNTKLSKALAASGATTEARVGMAVIAMNEGKITLVQAQGTAIPGATTTPQAGDGTTAGTASESLAIGADGFSTNPRITRNEIPELARGTSFNPSHIILHRTVSPASSNLRSPLGNAEQTGVGTHFYVGVNGEIAQASGLNNRTVHLRETGRGRVYDQSPSAPHNNNSIGIEVVGNYNATTKTWDPLTPAQTASVAFLVNSLQTNYNIPAANLRTHESVQPKTAGEGGTVLTAITPYLQTQSLGVPGAINQYYNGGQSTIQPGTQQGGTQQGNPATPTPTPARPQVRIQ